MKISTLIIAAVAILFCVNLNAQDIPTPYEFSFHSAVVEPIQFDFDIPDSSLAGAGNQHRLIYRDTSETVWNTTIYSSLYDACSVFTFSTQINYTPPSGKLEWYIHSENDTAVVSMSPKNVNNQFPVPDHLLADLGVDHIGDTEGTSATYLDIIHCHASYSNTKLYFAIDNNGGGFPTSSGIFTYYLYTVGIVDPDTEDSVAYALIYASVPGLFSPGLYKIDGADSSFTEIGSINYMINGNTLWMSCNISDLTSQPEWSEWPPPSQFIGVSPLTGTQNFTDLTVNDMGKLAVYLPKSNVLNYNLVNSAPLLTDPVITHIEPDTIHASITYSDSENHLPVTRQLIFGGTNYDLTACEKDYVGGTQFDVIFTVPETDWYLYYFEFSDGEYSVSTPLDSIYIETSTYICGDANADEAVDVSDAVFVINFAFGGGPAPDPVESGDANCDGVSDISDAVYIINYAFVQGSPAPCDPDNNGEPDC